MNETYKSLLRATDAESVLALLREFMLEADNVMSHLRAIEHACDDEVASTAT